MISAGAKGAAEADAFGLKKNEAGQGDGNEDFGQGQEELHDVILSFSGLILEEPI